MKKRFLNSIKTKIKNKYPNYSNDKIDEIMYGIEGIYLTITKTIIIFTMAFIFGIAKDLFFLLLAFNFIRLFAFGMHADSSIICLLFSSVIFLVSAYLCKVLTIRTPILYGLYFILLIIFIFYAPADTVKRPLIKKEKRIKFKILSILILLTYFSLSLFIKNSTIINYLIFGLVIEAILIIPLTYKLFKMPYKNYKTYGLNT